MAADRLQGGVMVGIVGLLVIAAIVVLVVRGGREGGVGSGRGASGLRRFLEYAFLAAALFTAAGGVLRLLRSALPAGVIVADTAVDVALGLSLTLVAVPVWVLLWRQVARRFAQDAGERGAPSWALYLLAATTVSLLLGFLDLVQTGRWLAGVADYQPETIAGAVVWALVWISHVRLLRRPSTAPTHPLAHTVVLSGAAIGLVGLAVGVGGVVRVGFDEVYRLVVGPGIVEPDAWTALREGLVVVLLAAPVWWWHWLRDRVRVAGGTWGEGYVTVAALGGLLTAVVAVAVALYAVLQWLFGVPDLPAAASHFSVLPAAAASFLVGGWAWWYHDAVLHETERPRRTEAERAQGYLVAAVGLVAAAAGVTVAVTVALRALAPAAVAVADPSGRDTLALAAALLLVGVPLWIVAWVPQQRWSSDAAELAAPSRRAYLFLLFGLTGVTALSSLAVILFVVFRDLLEETLAATVLYDVRVAIGLVLSAGAASAYHWTVYRRDRRVAIPERVHPRSVLLVSPDGQGLAAVLAERTGARVRRLHRLDQAARDVDPGPVAEAILASPHERVLVTVEDDGSVHVIPYETA